MLQDAKRKSDVEKAVWKWNRLQISLDKCKVWLAQPGIEDIETKDLRRCVLGELHVIASRTATNLYYGRSPGERAVEQLIHELHPASLEISGNAKR